MSTPITQTLKSSWSSRRLTLRLLRKHLRGSFASEFNNVVQPEILNLGVQQLEDIFTILLTYLRVWLIKMSRSK